jgi:hypothetical protein
MTCVIHRYADSPYTVTCWFWPFVKDIGGEGSWGSPPGHHGLKGGHVMNPWEKFGEIGGDGGGGTDNGIRAERIERFIEAQALLWSYDSAPRPPLSHQEAGPAIHRKTEKERQFANRRREGGRGAKSCERKKAWYSINYSILSGSKPTRSYGICS